MKRNAHALAARQRRAGAHSGRRRPDVFDDWEDEMELINVYIVTYKSEQQDTRIGAVYYNMEDAKAEAQRLDESSPWCVGAGVVIRQVDVERCINEAIDNVDED